MTALPRPGETPAVEWSDAVAAIAGCPGPPPAEAIDALIKAGDALAAEAHRAQRLREALPTLTQIKADQWFEWGEGCMCPACGAEPTYIGHGQHDGEHHAGCWIARLTAALETPTP